MQPFSEFTSERGRLINRRTFATLGQGRKAKKSMRNRDIKKIDKTLQRVHEREGRLRQALPVEGATQAPFNCGSMPARRALFFKILEDFHEVIKEGVFFLLVPGVSQASPYNLSYHCFIEGLGAIVDNGPALVKEH